MHTDTRVERPTDDVLARLEKHRNDAGTTYRARHAHKPGAVSDNVAKARVDYVPNHEKTELIPAVTLQAVVPLASRRAIPPLEEVPAAEGPVPPEPVAPISDRLLRRVLRGLRVMR